MCHATKYEVKNFFVSFLRVSTLKQADEGESLDVQGRQIEGYAHMHGLTLAEVLVEGGVSGSVPVEERPVGAALFAKLERGDIVIAAKLDRLFRSALDALKVVESLKGFVENDRLDLHLGRNVVRLLFLTPAAPRSVAPRLNHFQQRDPRIERQGALGLNSLQVGQKLEHELVGHEQPRSATRRCTSRKSQRRPQNLTCKNLKRAYRY
jgi:Resolvase, N terminal domain